MQQPGPESGDDVGLGEAMPSAGNGADATMELFPPGPLASVELQPDPVRVRASGERRVRAALLDADGRAIRRSATFVCSVRGAGLTVSGEGARPAICVAPETPPHAGPATTS